jgi:hypothetical protein
MRKSRFSESQIVAILKQADAGGKAIGQLLCRDHGAVVYRNDAVARERELSPEARLDFHQ